MNSSRYRATFVVWLAVACIGMPAQAQSSADTVVGLQFGSPLLVRQIDGHTVNALALAAGVPMGLEGARGGRRQSPPIVATGKPLREVLDAMTVADPRYTWRDDDGVIVIYPTGERPVQSLLNAQIGSLARRDAFGAQAHNALGRRTGGCHSHEVGSEPRPKKGPSAATLWSLYTLRQLAGRRRPLPRSQNGRWWP